MGSGVAAIAAEGCQTCALTAAAAVLCWGFNFSDQPGNGSATDSGAPVRFQVSELVKPRDIVGKLVPGFDRLSVAYGLSQIVANIGSVMRSATLKPVMPRERLAEKHRDDDR